MSAVCFSRTTKPAGFLGALCIAIVLIMVSGCEMATSPVRSSETRHVPASRILAPRKAYWTEDGIPVTVKTDRDYDTKLSPSFSLNGNPIAVIHEAERIDMRLRPGEYVFSVGPYMNPIQSYVKDQNVTIKAGENMTFRIYKEREDGPFNIEATSF